MKNMAKRWLEYALLLSGCLIFYIFWQDYLSSFVLIFYLALPLLSLLLLAPMAWGVRAELEAPSFGYNSGAPLPVRIKVRTASRMLAGRIRIRLKLRNETFLLETSETIYLSAGPKEQIVRHHLRSPYCGRITCQLAELRVYDMLGLFSFRKRLCGMHNLSLTVPPRMLLPELQERGAEAWDMDGDHFSQTTPGSDPSELFGIREFREGDRLSQIHWKLSGKLGRDMVIEGGQPVASRRFLLLEINGQSDCLEALLDTFYTLSGALLAQQAPHHAGWRDGEHLSLRDISHEEELQAAIEAIFSAGRAEQGAAALESCRSPEGHVAHVIYLTSRLTGGEAALLRERFPACKRTILLINERENVLPEAALQDLELILVDPVQVENSLRGFSI